MYLEASPYRKPGGRVGGRRGDQPLGCERGPRESMRKADRLYQEGLKFTRISATCEGISGRGTVGNLRFARGCKEAAVLYQRP